MVNKKCYIILYYYVTTPHPENTYLEKIWFRFLAKNLSLWYDWLMYIMNICQCVLIRTRNKKIFKKRKKENKSIVKIYWFKTNTRKNRFWLSTQNLCWDCPCDTLPIWQLALINNVESCDEQCWSWHSFSKSFYKSTWQKRTLCWIYCTYTVVKKTTWYEEDVSFHTD